jgi:hypothetical protein
MPRHAAEQLHEALGRAISKDFDAPSQRASNATI